MKTLIIDNYDSFTNNLYQMIAEINGVFPIVIKNDSYNFEDLKKLDFDNIIISPGPGHPAKKSDFGICSRILLEIDVPILGVCLGHQGIACVYGGIVKHANIPMHGRTSKIFHNDDILFKGIPTKFLVTRYHSLVVDDAKLPDCLKVTAMTNDGVIMGVRHLTKPLWGVQYHPESITTEYGMTLLQNFMDISKDYLYKQNIALSKRYCVDKSIKKNSQERHKYKLIVKKINNFYNADQVFNHLYAEKGEAIWLDSSLVVNDLSRFSIIGCLDGPNSYSVRYNVNTKIVTCIKNSIEHNLSLDIFDFLKMELDKITLIAEDLPFKFKCGFVGYFGYELYADSLAIDPKYQSEHPDAQFLFLDRAIVFDNKEKYCYLLELKNYNDAIVDDSWFEQTEKLLETSKNIKINIEKSMHLDCNAVFNRSHDEYIDDINKCLDYIKNGESYEICLTNRVVYEILVNPLKYYLSLRNINKTPYSAFLKFGDLSICSASIEKFLEIDVNGNIESKPIKGTLPRGKTLEEDEALIHQLKTDEKFRSENLMIVDLIRHDLGGVCEIGSVHVPKLMDVESYSTVHQLITTVRGKLNKEVSSIDCIKAAFPGGSMTGAPKRRTIDIINKLENGARGIYSGAIGYISVDGAIDLSIVIRTAVLTSSKVSIGVGGAIIALSSPEEEYLEILLKLKSLKIP